jgi:hypothetical protein
MLFFNLKTCYKKIIFTFILIFSLFYLIGVTMVSIANPLDHLTFYSKQLSPLFMFLSEEGILKSYQPNIKLVKENNIPNPYHFLLTQPLMTVGMTHYYQRTPKIRKPLYVIFNSNKMIYSRAVIMIVDKNKNRDDALLADKKNESVIVELGLIAMNFKTLPSSVIEGVKHSQIPFGILLANNKIAIHNADMTFFSLKCNKYLSTFLICQIGKTLYGRSNTLIRNDNNQWVAHVVEILTGANRS